VEEAEAKRDQTTLDWPEEKINQARSQLQIGYITLI
jgi:hypothetical protein